MLYFKPNTNAVFIGDEKEGNSKGLKTLFAVGEPKPSRVLELAVENKVDRVYFGAGFLRTVSKDYVNKIIKLIKDLEDIEFKKAETTQEVDAIIFALELKLSDTSELAQYGTLDETVSILEELIVTVCIGENSFTGTRYFDTIVALKKLETNTKIYLKFDIDNTVVVTPIDSIDVSGYHEFNNVDKVLYEEN